MTARIPTAVFLRSPVAWMDLTSEHFEPLAAGFPRLDLAFLDSFEELQDCIGEPELVLTWKFPAELYPPATRLKAVFTPAAGRERVAEDPRGLVQTFYGSFHGPMIAETLLGMMLYFNNRFAEMIDHQRRRVWDRDAQTRNSLLRGQHAILVGYGNIARHCAALLTSVGCTVSGLTRRHRDGTDPQTGARYVHWDDALLELPQADHVVLLLPGGDATHGRFSRRFLEAMKRTAVLYNFGRGGSVRDADLIWALENRLLAGAGLDVFEAEPLPSDSPFWTLENVLISPHSSCSYREYGKLFVTELETRLQNFL